MIDTLWNCYSKTGTFACTKTLCRCIVITNNNSIRSRDFIALSEKMCRKNEREGNMQKVLVVVDMQNDFIDGSLGTKEAQEIVTPVAEKIRNFEGDIYGTLDTHEEDYLSTQEGKNLPVKHCICGEDGWALNSEIMQAIAETKAEVHNFCRKGTFGSMELAQILKETYEDQKLKSN